MRKRYTPAGTRARTTHASPKARCAARRAQTSGGTLRATISGATRRTGSHGATRRTTAPGGAGHTFALRGRSLVCVVLLLLLLGPALFAQNLTITQVDTSKLLTQQQIGLYLSVTDRAGTPIEGLSSGGFTAREAPGDPGSEPNAEPPAAQFSQRPVTGFSTESNAEEGITFFLLVDNSGSMYDTLSGEETAEESRMRITHARSAIRTFTNEMDNPLDRVGLATFNTLYARHLLPTREKVRAARLLSEIEEPEREQSYTELYASLTEAAEDLGGYIGRKVLIVLSDGENYPYARYKEEPHPVYGEHIFTHREAIESMQREGISVFAVNFGGERDQQLPVVARETGGRVYDARDKQELAAVYSDIRDRVLKEYYLTYEASMSPADRTFVSLRFENEEGSATATRYYYSPTILGIPGERFNWLYLLALPGALGLWFLLAQMRFQNRRSDANLEVLSGGAATRVLGLTGERTVIGGSEDADLTISGTPTVRSRHATVVHDPKRKSYTVVGDAPIEVNNRPVTRKKLEPGDVISVGDSKVVFDAPDEEDSPEHKKGGSDRQA